MTSINFFNIHENYILESGQSVSGLTLAYQTFGKLNAQKDNVIWVVHALTANSNPMEWWPGVAGQGLAIDPDNYFIICVNNPGSPYGSTHPLSENRQTGTAYYQNFPLFTTRDIAQSFDQLRQHLGLDKISLLTGASLGGQIAMEWAILQPGVFDNLVLIATNARHSPWGIAFNESQRLAIEADTTFGEKSENAGAKGLKAARSIAMLSYRTATGYNESQRQSDHPLDQFNASSYQRYQGDKLVNRFDAYSYYALTRTMDSHNVARNRESLTSALQTIDAYTLVIGITTDLLFPTIEQKQLATHIPNARYAEIHSELGHDGFLTEAAKVGHHIKTVLNRRNRKTKRFPLAV